MRYSNEWLKDRLKEGRAVEFYFFWGHQPRKDGNIGKSCFSQWFERPFEHKGIQYLTAEHWMMAEKARLFADHEHLQKILSSSSPREAKKLGRKVKNFDEKVWGDNREEIVKNGNYLKFKQHNDLWEFLDQTENKVIVEASPYDRIWGIGKKSDAIGIEDPSTWNGLNLLGYALMEVRDKLREQE